MTQLRYLTGKVEKEVTVYKTHDHVRTTSRYYSVKHFNSFPRIVINTLYGRSIRFSNSCFCDTVKETISGNQVKAENVSIDLLEIIIVPTIILQRVSRIRTDFVFFTFLISP